MNSVFIVSGWLFEWCVHYSFLLLFKFLCLPTQVRGVGIERGVQIDQVYALAGDVFAQDFEIVTIVKRVHCDWLPVYCFRHAPYTSRS
jgi:hypothetical protein